MNELDPPPARPAKFKTAVLARYQERYPDFGPTLATEKLALDGLLVDHETLRRWLRKYCASSSDIMKAGLWQKRRKSAQHRSWRERRAHFGELVQLDGSPMVRKAGWQMLFGEHGG